MPSLIKFETPKGFIGVWKIDETISDFMNMYPNDMDMKSISSGKGSSELMLERLAVRTLVHSLLKDDLVKIIHNEDGKPCLLNSIFNISISHTKGYAAVYLSKDEIPGIDIEIIGSRATKLSSRFMNEKELLQFSSGIDDESATLYWSAKETIYKMIGKSVVNFKDALIVTSFGLEDKSKLYFEIKGDRCTKKEIVHYLISHGFVLTWASII